MSYETEDDMFGPETPSPPTENKLKRSGIEEIINRIEQFGNLDGPFRLDSRNKLDPNTPRPQRISVVPKKD